MNEKKIVAPVGGMAKRSRVLGRGVGLLTVVLVAIGAALLPTWALMSAQSSPPEAPSSWGGQPGGAVTTRIYPGGYIADARVDPGGQLVSIRYHAPTTATVSEQFNPTWPAVINTKSQEFAVRFWPIHFEWIEGTDDALIVGVSPFDGETLVFERWGFDSSVGPDSKTVVDAQTGELEVMWALPPREKVNQLIAKNYQDLGLPGIPAFLIENAAIPSGARWFVGVSGFSSIYQLDLSTGASWVAAESASSGGGALLVPDLVLEDWTACTGLVHLDDGMVYSLYDHTKIKSEWIRLIDSDQDGELDAWVRYTNENPTTKYGVFDGRITSEF